MTTVEIEYCVPCGHLDRAQQLQEEILTTYGQGVDSVALVTEDGGTFRVHVNEEEIFDIDDSEYSPDSIVETLGSYQ